MGKYTVVIKVNSLNEFALQKPTTYEWTKQTPEVSLTQSKLVLLQVILQTTVREHSLIGRSALPTIRGGMYIRRFGNCLSCKNIKTEISCGKIYIYRFHVLSRQCGVDEWIRRAYNYLCFTVIQFSIFTDIFNQPAFQYRHQTSAMKFNKDMYRAKCRSVVCVLLIVNLQITIAMWVPSQLVIIYVSSRSCTVWKDRIFTHNIRCNPF